MRKVENNNKITQNVEKLRFLHNIHESRRRLSSTASVYGDSVCACSQNGYSVKAERIRVNDAGYFWPRVTLGRPYPTYHFDLEGWQKYPLDWILWGGGGGAYSPLELQISFKKIVSLSILNGFERPIHLWIGNDTYNFTKMAVILNFHVNMSPSSILCVFGPFLKQLFSSFMCITAQYYVDIMMPRTRRKKPYIKGNCSVYRFYHIYSIQNILLGLSLLRVNLT